MADEDARSRLDDGTERAARWAASISQVRESFIDSLVAKGMRLVSDESSGGESEAELTNGRVTVLLGKGFPYRLPEVRRDDPGPRSWHQDNRGHLCLYSSLDNDSLPWLDVDAFLARIDEWYTKADAGWPDDPPALDLEAYLSLPLDVRYVLYPDLTSIDGYVRFEADFRQMRLLDDKKVPKKSSRGYVSGYVTDIGEVTTPPCDWEDLLASTAEAERIRGAIDRMRVEVLLIKYHRFSGQGSSRRKQKGVLAVTLKTVGKSPVRVPHLAWSGCTDDTAMRLRSGSAAGALKTKTVGVVGAGSLGSFICDSLSRAGLGKLIVQDGEFLTPGNLTRHLIGDLNYVGALKAQAIEIYLGARAYNRTRIKAIHSPLTLPAEAAKLLHECDLVIDASADGAVASMLEDAARHLGATFLSACLKNEGTTLRVDVIPPLDGADPLPPSTYRAPTGPEQFEAGCGVPVSPTPPYAVTEAAAMTVRHAAGLLIEEPVDPTGEERDFG